MRWTVGSGAHFDAPIVRGAPYASAVYQKVSCPRSPGPHPKPGPGPDPDHCP
jgi:hypothetical protein